MNISIIGVGYVGLVTGACLCEFGSNVLCMDTDDDKIRKLKDGIIPIYEPGLKDIVESNYNSGRLKFTTDIRKAVEQAEIIFITVGTPTLEDGSADVSSVISAAREIAKNMTDYKIVVNKSTVPVGTGKRVKEEIKTVLGKLGKNIDFAVVSNPEFLREGSAVMDFVKPDRIVIGTDSEKASCLMKKLYGTQALLKIPIIVTNIETAEMIKYASNAFLAAKVSFINEIASMCELCGADISVVSRAMGLDSRIGPNFLNPGPGFGGSCFPKDTKALISIGRSIGYIPKIVKTALSVNDDQKKRVFKKIKNTVKSLKNSTISILGIAFKAETDDIREAPSIAIIEALLESKANVRVYDPQAMDNLKRLRPDLKVQYYDDIYSLCEGADCIILMTEWQQFRSLDFTRLKTIVKKPVFIDLKNMFEPEYIRSFGFLYRGVGRK